MVVSVTEVRNNLDIYLMLCAKEDIIITEDSAVIAVLSGIDKSDVIVDVETGIVMERAEAYDIYGGRKASYEEFLELTKDTEDRYEYIDGEIFYLASPKTTHQTVLTELFGIFYSWFKDKKCRPMVAPYDITLKRHPEDKNLVQPDIMVICDLKEHLDERDYYMGTPVLVVEIISEFTRNKDLVRKLNLYMKCGIQEYWTINPKSREVGIYLFKEKVISNSITIAFKETETAQSYYFEGLTVPLDMIFK